MVCSSPSDDEMLCWEAAQFIKHTVVCGLLSLPALTASQRLFTSRKYDRLYVYLTVCLGECACLEVASRRVSAYAGASGLQGADVKWVDTVTPVQYTQRNIKT